MRLSDVFGGVGIILSWLAMIVFGALVWVGIGTTILEIAGVINWGLGLALTPLLIGAAGYVLMFLILATIVALLDL